MEELDRVIDRAGKVLSQISDYPVFTMAAAKEQVTVKRFDLLMVEGHSFGAHRLGGGDIGLYNRPQDALFSV